MQQAIPPGQSAPSIDDSAETGDFIWSPDYPVSNGFEDQPSEPAGAKNERQQLDRIRNQLTGLTELGELHFYGAQVTPAGAAKLKKSLPDCQILR